MSEIDFLRNEIFSRFGSVKRARGCFLYTAKGVRLTDLYQEGGRAVLGWGGSSAFTLFKNTMNRGLTGSFPTDYPHRSKRAVEKLFNSSRELFYFSSKEAALRSAIMLSPAGTSMFRPWSPAETNWAKVDCIVFVPPLAWSENLYILAVNTELCQKKSDLFASIKSDTFVPAPLHAGIARSIYDLIKVIQEREEKDWFIYDTILTKYWERKGPYLFSKVPLEKYKAFIQHCLDCNLVISPDCREPSLVPYGADKGVFSKLKNKPFEF
ncbi:MAG: hypothetical protein K6F15_03335 [Treponema sp.]|nr:hypothetical protein [Treponema sp.]